MSPVIVTIVICYLIGLLLVGWFSSSKIESNDDFLVAGRRLGPVLMAGTLAATEIGGGSSMGVVEKAYGNWGLGAVWYVVTMAIAFMVLAFFAPKLRNSLVRTIPEYFRNRYGEAPSFISAIIMILPLIGLTAIQFTASAVVFSTMTGFNYLISVLIIGAVVTGYSVMGGLWSVTLTDFIQMILIVFGMALIIPFALHSGGGWENIASHIPETKFSLTKNIGWGTIISLVIMYTTSFAVGQEAVQRYFAAKDEKAAVKGSLLASLVFILFAFIPAILGLITFALVQQGVVDGSSIMQNGARYALPTLAIQTMPKFLVGILFAGLISATMSSASSDLLGAGSIFSNDIYRVYINKKASDKHTLIMTKLTMCIIGVIGVIVAIMNTQSIIAVLMFSFSLRASGFFMPYVLGHYWKSASWSGAMGSIIVGSSIMVLMEKNIIPDFFEFEPIFTGLISSLIAFVVFTKLFPSKKIEIHNS
ncbi:MAG: sodium:solute symporter family protein [Victivallales bacterium]|nr:sodium:solute symporter family protein [Victivallales bacterium]